MSSLISYYGGKQKIAFRIVAEIEKISHTVYGEVFAGGLAVLYAKNIPHYTNTDFYREFINDTDELLINLYRVARTHKEEFYDLIQWTPYSQSEHKKATEICKVPSEHSVIEKAWAYYVNIQCSFSNKLNAGWVARVLSQNGAATWTSKKKQLLKQLERLSSVHISCENAINCIKRIDSPHTLIYADPPYPGANQGHYGGYSMEDWQELCDTLDNCQSSYILSNYHQDIQPKSAQQIIKINTTMSASGKGKVNRKNKGRAASKEEMGERTRVEYLWICDRSKSMRKDLEFCRVKQHSLFEQKPCSHPQSLSPSLTIQSQPTT